MASLLIAVFLGFLVPLISPLGASSPSDPVWVLTSRLSHEAGFDGIQYKSQDLEVRFMCRSNKPSVRLGWRIQSTHPYFSDVQNLYRKARSNRSNWIGDQAVVIGALVVKTEQAAIFVSPIWVMYNQSNWFRITIVSLQTKEGPYFDRFAQLAKLYREPNPSFDLAIQSKDSGVTPLPINQVNLQKAMIALTDVRCPFINNVEF